MINETESRNENGGSELLSEAAMLIDALRKENAELARQLAEIRTLGAKEHLEW